MEKIIITITIMIIITIIITITMIIIILIERRGKKSDDKRIPKESFGIPREPQVTQSYARLTVAAIGLTAGIDSLKMIMMILLGDSWILGFWGQKKDE